MHTATVNILDVTEKGLLIALIIRGILPRYEVYSEIV